MRRALLLVLLLAVVITVVLSVTPVGAVPSLPGPCIDHVSSAGDPEVAGDVRCTGRFIDVHVDGVARSPRPLWAGQWAVVEQSGTLHRGWCVHNRGVHPTTSATAASAPIDLPHDPGGGRSGYLAWRYGNTDDPDTAAALWAVFHWYAQDAAGTARSSQPGGPLVPSIGALGAMTGDAALQQRAEELVVEAERFGAPWDLAMESEGSGIVVSLRAADQPVPGHEIDVSAGDVMTTLITDDIGVARLDLGEWFAGTVVAAAEAPGPAVAWWGPQAWADPHGVQPLLSAGPTVTLAAELELAAVEVPATTTVPPTIVPPTTGTTVPPTTTTTTTVLPETTTTNLPPTIVMEQLPAAGGDTPAPLAVGLVVAGVGLTAAVRRRTLPR